MSDEMPRTGKDGFFGHPTGLGYLAFTEVWERFSYYGMQALLPLYMVSHLFLPQTAGKVVGLDDFRATIESVTGPLSNVAFGAQVFGLYGGGVYFAILLGGWIGDRVTGRTAAVLLGGCLMAAGHLAMAFEQYFLIALLLLITGAGLFKGNLLVQVGGLYALEDVRRTRAFGVYGIAAQTGAMLAPLICGTLGEIYGWHWGFGAAAVGMVLGLTIYVAGMRHLPGSVPPAPKPVAVSADVAADGGRPVPALLLVFLAYGCIIGAVLQAYGILLVWAVDHVDRVVLGFQTPVTWILIWDGVVCVGGVFVAFWIWARQARSGREPTDIEKMTTAGWIGAAAFLTLFAGGAIGMAKTPLIVIILFFTLIAMAIVYVDLPLKAVTTRCAPPHLATTLVGMMLAMFGVASIGAGAVGRYYEIWGAQGFWLLNAAISATGALLLIVTKRWTSRHLRNA